METPAVSRAHGLRLAVADPRSALPGVLDVGWHAQADVPFRPGEEFPFDDSAVEAMVVGDFFPALAAESRLQFLLECRRVLRPGGLLRLPTDDAARTDMAAAGSRANESGSYHAAILEMAMRVGLVPMNEARVDADLSAALPSDQAPATTLDFTKPERRVTGNPFVSILIPAFNPRFFAVCLDSALAQTYQNVELIICDDSSGPEIEQLVRARAAPSWVHYERNAPRLGPRGNFVRCFERARGEFVKFLCDDDLLAPRCIERLLDAFRGASDVTLATSHRSRIDEHGTRLGDQPATMPIILEDSVIVGHTLANAMIMAGLNTIGEPSTTLFRKREFLDQAPGYFHFNGAPGHGIIDMIMWSVLLLRGNAVYLNESLSSFRVHPAQRQHGPKTRQFSIASIRSLQAAWLGLELHRRNEPHLLVAKPFPPDDGDWRSTPIVGFAARRMAR